MGLFDLTVRHRQPEIMDQPGLDAQQHQRALRALARINQLSGATRFYWPALRDLATEFHPRPLRVLDVACGGGDVAISLWNRAARSEVSLDVEGCDISPVATSLARRRAADHQADVRFFEHDVVQDSLPSGYDVITCSLFLHHLEEPVVVDLLRRMSESTTMILVNDLIRSRLGYLFAALGTRSLTRSSVVHTDGPRSVEGAFTCEEARLLAQNAGLESVSVTKRWPERWLLRWRRP